MHLQLLVVLPAIPVGIQRQLVHLRDIHVLLFIFPNLSGKGRIADEKIHLLLLPLMRSAEYDGRGCVLKVEIFNISDFLEIPRK